MNKHRADNDPPESVWSWGWKFHHIGIPTEEKKPGEKFLPAFGMYVSGFSSSPFGIEWMRFEDHSPVNKLIRTVPHIAFEVKSVIGEIAAHDLKIITPPNEPGEGIVVAMIEHNGAPVELLEFSEQK